MNKKTKKKQQTFLTIVALVLVLKNQNFIQRKESLYLTYFLCLVVVGKFRSRERNLP